MGFESAAVTCPGRDSNPQASEKAEVFETSVSAVPPPGHQEERLLWHRRGPKSTWRTQVIKSFLRPPRGPVSGQVDCTSIAWAPIDAQPPNKVDVSPGFQEA